MVDRRTQRAIAVIALLILVTWALRGYLPGVERMADRERPSSSPWALVADIALLSGSVVIIGIAIIARLRDRDSRPSPSGPLPRGAGAMGRPTWRFALIALAVVIGWLLLVSLLSRFAAPGGVDHPTSGAPPVPESSGAPPTAAVPPRAPDQSPEPDTNVVGYLIAPMLVLMVLIVVGTAIAARRQKRVVAPYATPVDGPGPTASSAAADSLARAAEVGLAEIGDLSREPREAIIACYTAMERELTHVPGVAPQDFDTPTEVLERAVDHGALHADSATQLVELFEEARFSPHVMNEGHRDVAVQVLRLVLAELRSLA